MVVEIIKTIGATKEQVAKKEFNIFVAISLGNRWFSKDNLRECIIWALKFTKHNKLPIIVADGVHAINYEVRNDYNPTRAMERALRVGDEKIIMLKRVISSLSKEDQDKIIILRWDDLEKSFRYYDFKKLFYDEFDQNPNFKNFIVNIVKSNLGDESEEFSEQEIEKLAQYVLDELPLFLRGIEYGRVLYNLHPYPKFTMLNDLAERMWAGEIFQELYEKIGKPKVAIVELQVLQ